VPRDWPSSIALLARGIAQLPDAARATLLYELLLPHRERAIPVGRAGLCHGPTELYLGLLAATGGRWEDAERHYDAALRWAQRCGPGLSVAWAGTYWAEALLSRGAPGDRERASSLAAEALRFAEERVSGRLATWARAVVSGLR
jgi:tetratricopeptide (TPR) repeat protein